MMRNLMVTLVVGLIAVGCGDEAFKGQEIVLGAVVDQTGTQAESSWIQAIQMAISQMNEALGAEGEDAFRFRLRVQDSENLVAKGVDRALFLVREEQARVIITDTTQVVEGVLSTFYDDDASNDLNVPVQCSSCTSGNLLNPNYVDASGNLLLQDVRRNTGRWMSRTTMTTVPMGNIAHFVARDHQWSPALVPNRGPAGDLNNDGVIKIAVLGSDEPFGQAGTNAVRNNANGVYSASGFTFGTDASATLIVERILHPNLGFNDVDFNPIINRLIDNETECQSCNPAVATFVDGHEPDYIVMVSFQQFTAGFTETYALSGKKQIPVIHFHTFRQTNTLFRLGSLAEGQVGISHELLNGTADGTPGAIYRDDFRKAYGFAPNFWDTAYYDNAMTFMLAILIAQQQAGAVDVDSALVRDRLQCTSQPTTLGYTVTLPWLDCPGGPATVITPGVASLRDAVRQIAAGGAIDYDGAAGPNDYDANKNVRTRINHYEVRNGAFVDLDTFECLNPADNRCGR